VTGVRQTVVHVGGWQDHPNAWRLCVPGAQHGRDPRSPGGLWTYPAKTARLRRADELTRLATVWGRDPAAEPFTNTEPRRILRLLREVVETKIDKQTDR
jgi:hypothetical protein